MTSATLGVHNLHNLHMKFMRAKFANSVLHIFFIFLHINAKETTERHTLGATTNYLHIICILFQFLNIFSFLHILACFTYAYSSI